MTDPRRNSLALVASLLLVLGCGSCSAKIEGTAGDTARDDAGVEDQRPSDVGAAPTDVSAGSGGSGGSPPSDVRPEAGQKLDTAPPVSATINLTTCAGRNGDDAALPGNTSEPVVAFDKSRQYITYFSGAPLQVLITKYDGASCATPVKVNVTNAVDEAGLTSHNAPSVFVDGLGYLYVTYMGTQIWSQGGFNSNQDDPFIRRSTRPHDITAWEAERKMRFANFAELSGNTLADGSVLFVAGSTNGRIDIVEPGGAYRWSAMRQVIAQDASSAGDPVTAKASNRFTKAVFEPSRTNAKRIYVVWGWACDAGSTTSDCKAYWDDSHEVYFAYTDDAGVTWRNLQNTKSVTAPLCPASANYCNGDKTKGILHNDAAFRVSDTRQRDFRAIWEDSDGTIYVAFSKSRTHATPAAALMMLKLRVGETPQEITVSPEAHGSVAGIRKEGSILYIWTTLVANDLVYEYRSTDGGTKWQRTDLFGTYCARLHGNTSMVGANMVSMACVHVTSATASDVLYYQKEF